MTKRPDGREGFQLHRSGEGTPEEFRGFGGVNASGVPEYMNPWDAIYALYFTNRQGVYGDVQGALSTRPGYASGPKYGFPSYAGDNTAGEDSIVRGVKKWYPNELFLGGTLQNGEAVRLIADRLEHLSGVAGWLPIPGAESGISTAGYPEMTVFGIPDKVLVIPHLTEGLMCWDGEHFWKQSIPQASGGGDISGCMYTAQVNGKMFVCGNYFDAGEGLNIYHCGAGNLGTYTNPTSYAAWTTPNGGMFRVYAAHSREKRSDPMRVTGFGEILGRLVIFTETGRYVVTAPGSGMETVDYESGCGCLTGGLISSFMGRLYWWDEENCYEYYGGDPVPIGSRVNPIARHIKFTDDSGNLIVQNFFSFVFMGQIWNNIRTSGLRGISGNYVNTNLIYDVRRRTWYVWNIPMCAATVAEAGRDLGQLYFSSAEPRSGKYKSHRFAADDQHSGEAVFSDDGRDITAIWRTPRLGGPPEVGMVNKKWWFMRVNQEVYDVTHLGFAALFQFLGTDELMPGGLTTGTYTDPITHVIDKKVVIGTNTKFLRDLRVGQYIGASADPLQNGKIASIQDNTHLTLSADWAYTALSNSEWCAFWKVLWPSDPTRTPVEKFGLNQTVSARTTFDLTVKGQGRLTVKEMELVCDLLPLDQEDIPR
jgi:hypothetical protein